MGISQGSFGVFLPVLMEEFDSGRGQTGEWQTSTLSDFKLIIQTTSVVEPRLELGLRELNFREQIIGDEKVQQKVDALSIVHPFIELN